MNKIGKLITQIATGATAFAGALACAYFLTPNKVKQLDQTQRSGRKTAGTASEVIDEGDSNFMKFVSRLTKDVGMSENSEKEYYGFNMEFEDFALSLRKDNNSALNNISIDGGLDFMMKGLHDINFNLYTDIDYNGYVVPVDIGYVNKTAYLGLNDLRLKVGSATIDELLGNEEKGIESILYSYFIARKEDGGINFNLEQFYIDAYTALTDKLLGSINVGSLTSSFKMGEIGDNEVGVGLTVDEKETSTGYDFDLKVKINKEDKETGEINSTPINVVISVDENYRLSRVDLNKIELGNFSIEGALNITPIKDHVVLSPENENFVKYNPDHKFIEVINYKGWLQKLAHFLDEDNQKIGLDFALDLASSLPNSLSEIGSVKGSINADFSQLIDLSNYQAYDENGPIVRSNKAPKFVENILNKATFSIDVSFFGQQNEEYGNLSLKYKDGDGYITLNESLDSKNEPVSVLRAKVDTETVNWIMDKVPEMVSDLTGDEQATSNLFDFLTESSLINGIKSGDYSVILDLLKGISNDEDSIDVSLDLSSLGLGENAVANIVLDSSVEENHRVFNLDLANVKVGDLNLGASIATDEFKSIVIGETESYDSLAFLPTVVDQVSSILDTKQTGFEISGSLLDDKNVGFTLNGAGQFDYGNKHGFGTLTIDQYKYANAGLWYSHQIAIDVDNTTSDFAKNSAYFIYGNPSGDNVKGKVTVQSVMDLIDIVKTFISESKEESKWNKFIGPIMEMMSVSELSNIINSKDYFRFVKNDLLKSVKKSGDTLEIVIGGAIFDLASDINIKVNFVNDKIDTLSVENLCFNDSKVLNLSLSLREYNSNKVSPVNKNASFMDLSSISLLLKFGINTTKNNYYHLSATVDLNVFGFFTLDTFTLHVYVVIKDEYCKIYGVIDDAKLSTFAQDYAPLVTRSLKSEFTFETYPDGDPNKTDGVGGYFHFKTTKVVGKIFTTSTEIKHYKTTSKNLLEGNNIVTYLLNDFLLIRSTYTSSLTNISMESEEQKPAGDFTNTFTSTGFNYDESKRRWDIGVNLNELTGISALKTLEVKLYGSAAEKFTSLWVELNVANLLTVEATINLEDTPTSTTDWSSSVQSAFTAINNVDFPANKLNKPTECIGY